jgi:hypothetical protein
MAVSLIFEKSLLSIERAGKGGRGRAGFFNEFLWQWVMHFLNLL